MLGLTKTKHFAFVNGDISIVEGFAESVAFASTYEDYVMVGRRHHLEAAMPVSIVTKQDLYALRTTIQEVPFAHGYAIDYFVLRSQDWIKILEDFPAFVVGAWRWDNFFLANTFKLGFSVIDASYTASILHQRDHQPNHDHSQRRGADLNNLLATRSSGDDFWFGSIAFADIVLEKNGSKIVSRPTSEIQTVARKAFIAGVFHGFDDVRGIRNVLDEFNMHLGFEH
ncbi:hypothetical protein N8152_01545 [bacterium]|nr:hypothetical protein [bacterium]